ncbi:MAG: 23S rRNA (uridine(2552)-2'-O)-methyltransferase RlmE [Gammaproteobacteria bacterium]|nr:23S rRNA (uridine(2552)-2'-O)-methyltransferase RlmE [Gammaproteobacteria bacterium]
MPRSKQSKKWLKEHFDDIYVKQAQDAGYRSRAVFKLKEIDEKDRLLRRGMTVVDLGAAPGGWCQYARERLAPEDKVIALDILEMDALAGVTIIQGDFTQESVLEQLLALLNGHPVDLVLSDMAPNISGMKVVDQPRAMYLAELALDFCQRALAQGGDFLVKVFQGEGTDAYIKELRQQFAQVIIRKPKASRPRSREVYLLARGFKGAQPRDGTGLA